jgi:hypothetical protein
MQFWVAESNHVKVPINTAQRRSMMGEPNKGDTTDSSSAGHVYLQLDGVLRDHYLQHAYEYFRNLHSKFQPDVVKPHSPMILTVCNIRRLPIVS